MRVAGIKRLIVAIIPALLILACGIGCLSCKSKKQPSNTSVAEGLPEGHRVVPWRPEKLVIAVDLSLSVRGFFANGRSEAAGMDNLFDTLREILGDQGITVKPLALTGKGLELWPEHAQTEAGRFFKSLPHRGDLFNVGYNDLVVGIDSLAEQVKHGGPRSLGILFSDMIQSVPKEKSDSTGVGQSLGLAGADVANGGLGLGVHLLRVDLPFSGRYYPEVPSGPGFALPTGVLRPFYLVVISPTPASGARFVSEFCSLWVEKTQDRDHVSLVSLTPDLTPFLRLDLAQSDRKRTRDFGWLSPSPSPWLAHALRKGSKRDADLELKIIPLEFPKSVRDFTQEVISKETVKIQPVDGLPRAPVDISQNGSGSEYNVKIHAKTSHREQVDSIVQLFVPSLGGAGSLTPSWVSDINTDRDDQQSLKLHKGSVIPTLNLRSIIETAQRRIGVRPAAVGYIELSKE